MNTAEAACDIALIEAGAVLFQEVTPMQRGLEAYLPVKVTEVLAAHHIGLKDLSRLAVITGPGSFTGIRIGLGFARGLAVILKIPVIGLTSLEAGLHPDRREPVMLALPAKKRPPELSFWTQSLVQGFGTGPVLEEEESALQDRAFEIATPNAAWAGLKALSALPDAHKASPVYARTPDAKPVSSKPVTSSARPA